MRASVPSASGRNKTLEKEERKMGRNKDFGLDSMTSPSSRMSGRVNKGSCDMGPGWAGCSVGVDMGEAVQVASAGLHPRLELGASAFSRYLVQGNQNRKSRCHGDQRGPSRHRGK